MKYTYHIRTDIIKDEEGKEQPVYGIEVWLEEAVVRAIPDLMTDFNRINHLVVLCNKLELSPIHLSDVIEDELTG